MPTTSRPDEIMVMVAALLNDTARTIYTDTNVLPYLNMALDDLQETFELNNVPVTNDATEVIFVKAGVTRIGFGTNPSLPGDLVDIQQLYERTAGINPFVHMERKTFIPKVLEDQEIAQFLIWAWAKQEVRLISATADNDLKIDYVASIFNTPIALADIGATLGIINVKQYLGYKTAALCSMFVGENETRASALNGLANTAQEIELGIPTKGRQSIVTRRRPFMGSYKRRGSYY